MQPGKVVHKFKSEKGKDIVFRYPKSEDLRAMWAYINKLSKEQTFISFQGQKITLKEEKEHLDSLLKKIKEDKAVQLLAFHKDALIGICDIELKTRIESHVGVFGISIDLGFRKERIGTLLIEKAMEEAIKNLKDLKIINLGVFGNNPVALSLYKKYGFQLEGLLPGGIKYKDGFVDHIYMYKKVK